MTFSYTPGGTTTLDDIRVLIGDVDANANTEQRLEDEEIARLVSLEGPNVYAAAAAACETLAAKFLRKPEGLQGGNDRVMPTDRVTHLRRRARELRARAESGAVPYAGGLSKSERETALADTDRITPAFSRGQLDGEGTTDASCPHP